MRIVKSRENPFSILDDLHQEINKLFDISFDRFPGQSNETLAPRLDISEDEANIYVDADMPGFDQKDINVKMKGDTLVISAQKEQKKEEKKKNYYRCERFQGNFYRALIIPKNVDVKKINAKHEKGVLSVTLPKKEEEKEKEININVG